MRVPAPLVRTGAMLQADARALARDPLLRALLVAPLVLVLVLVLGVPLVEGWAAAAAGIDLEPHRPLLVAFLAGVVLPFFFGAFTGLLLLEDRESGVLAAVAVCPVGLGSYLVARCGWGAAGAAVTVLGALRLEGSVGVGTAAVAGVLAAGFAVVASLLVGSLAMDRLEGLAVVKAALLPLGLVVLVDVAAPPWSWLLWSLPSMGPVAVLVDGGAGGPVRAAAPVAGAVQLLAWTALLHRRLLGRVG